MTVSEINEILQRIQAIGPATLISVLLSLAGLIFVASLGFMLYKVSRPAFSLIEKLTSQLKDLTERSEQNKSDTARTMAQNTIAIETLRNGTIEAFTKLSEEFARSYKEVSLSVSDGFRKNEEGRTKVNDAILEAVGTVNLAVGDLSSYITKELGIIRDAVSKIQNPSLDEVIRRLDDLERKIDASRIGPLQ